MQNYDSNLKMQNLKGKIFVLFIAYLLTSAIPTKASSLQHSINQADSLFSSKKYTESFFLYDSIFFSKKSYSPQMLTKMAFIKEAIGEYDQALYYLNYLYFWHPSQRVADKMLALAEKHQLEGYEVNDETILFEFFTNYKNDTLWAICALIALLTIALVFLKFKKQKLSYSLLFFILVFMSAAFYINNFNPFPKKAIIAQNNAFVMSAPSSASSYILSEEKGNRVSVMDEKDNWYFIELEDSAGYTKKSNLNVIEAY